MFAVVWTLKCELTNHDVFTRNVPVDKHLGPTQM
jgi:hypothetical protein